MLTVTCRKLNATARLANFAAYRNAITRPPRSALAVASCALLTIFSVGRSVMIRKRSLGGALCALAAEPYVRMDSHPAERSAVTDDRRRNA